MTSITCPKCGEDLTVTPASECPTCGAKIATPPTPKILLGALLQIAITATLLLLLGFPKFMIAMFATLILMRAALSAWAKTKVVARTKAPERPIAHPTLLSIINFATALCALVFVATALFGLAMFLNSWNTWSQYQGQPHHETDFVVKRAYYQPRRKGNADIYASGTVEGSREWMSLRPYFESLPRNQAELDSQVPPETSIHVYLYPRLKGRARVVVYEEGPPDEPARRAVMNTILYVPLGLGATALLIFLLTRLRRLCYLSNQLKMVGVSSGF